MKEEQDVSDILLDHLLLPPGISLKQLRSSRYQDKLLDHLRGSLTDFGETLSDQHQNHVGKVVDALRDFRICHEQDLNHLQVLLQSLATTGKCLLPYLKDSILTVKFRSNNHTHLSGRSKCRHDRKPG